MAPTVQSSELSKEYHAIVESHDMVIRIVEHDSDQLMEGESVPKKVHEFSVVREIVSKASTYFNKLLAANFKEGQQTTIDLHEDNPSAMAVWFKIMHGCALDIAVVKSTTMKGVWEVLAAAHKYGLDPKGDNAKAWFAAWHDGGFLQSSQEFMITEFKTYQMVLFPCYAFDHAAGFAAATKYLVYNARGHISELRPRGFRHDHLRLDSAIMSQVNAAKGRLRTILHGGLHAPFDRLLLHATCDCKANTLWSYMRAIANTGAWPLQIIYLKSMQAVLDKLRTFEGSVMAGQGCHLCTFDFDRTVSVAVHKTQVYFDGLCLDCMSTSKHGDADEDYWNEANQDDKYDEGCRVTHGEPTSYYSSHCRREKKVEWTQQRGTEMH